MKRILIVVDEDKEMARTVEIGATLARDLGASVRLAHVIDPRQAAAPEGGVDVALVLDDLRRCGQAIVQSAHGQIGEAVPADCVIAEGRPADEIASIARQWGADLIVVGAPRGHWLSRLFDGQLAAALSQRVPCPILTV
jgi:nucleotide-binding universal stress UspA family protein